MSQELYISEDQNQSNPICKNAEGQGEVGAQSTCFLLHNGVLMKHSDADMKNYVVSTTCRQKEISSIFPSVPSSQVKGCLCCDICARECKCGGQMCTSLDFEFASEQEDQCHALQSRPVTPEQRSELFFKLESYRQTLLPANISSCPQVSFATSLFEFGDVQIKQVLTNCNKIFGFNDIKKYIEIWRMVHANNILLALHEVFDDFELDESALDILDEYYEEDMDSGWIEIRDDSELDFHGTSFLKDFTNDAMETSETELDISAQLDQLVLEKF